MIRLIIKDSDSKDYSFELDPNEPTSLRGECETTSQFIQNNEDIMNKTKEKGLEENKERFSLQSLEFERFRNQILAWIDKPSRVKLGADDTLDFPEGLSTLEKVDKLSLLLPDVKRIPLTFDEESRKQLDDLYDVVSVANALVYTKDAIKDWIQSGKSIKDIRQELSEIGSDVLTVYSAARRKMTLEQVLEDQYRGLGLRYEEVTELEAVASRRREINVRRANWEMSREYAVSGEVDRAQKSFQFDKEIESVTSTLWKILHLGANYLSSRERLEIKRHLEQNPTLDSETYVEDKLRNLRISNLENFRIQRDDYKLPRVKS
jgi:hypothetical protein